MRSMPFSGSAFPVSVAPVALALAVSVAMDRLQWAAELPASVQDAITIFVAIVAEALPFVLIGVVVSALIHRFVSPAHVSRVLPHSPLLAFPAVASLGLLLPVCECGNVPVARQLIRQGLRPSYALTFLLASPIFNPAVMLTTYAAFRWNLDIVVGRFALALLVAVLVGGYFYLSGDDHLLKEEQSSPHQPHDPTCELDDHARRSLADEFVELFTALCAGAALAALVQVVVPYEALSSLGDVAVVSILAMMTLAIVVSICSTVDAFFALAYASTFPSSALLAFLVLGPMIDIKSIAMLQQNWKPRTVLTTALLVGELVFVATLAGHHWGLT